MLPSSPVLCIVPYPPLRFSLVIRGYNQEYRPEARWLVTFRTIEEAKTALTSVAGRTLALFPVRATLVPLATVEEYRILNELLEMPQNCLLASGFPVGFSPDALRRLFSDYRFASLDDPILNRYLGPFALIA